MKIKNKEILEQLEIFRNKSCCSYTQIKADHAISKLRLMLEEHECDTLLIEREHWLLGHGTAQTVYDICKELENKYSK